MRRRSSALLLLATILGFRLAVPSAVAARGQETPDRPSAAEVRALWVTRSSLMTPAAVETMVKAARASGFNTLLVQVRGRGDAYFRDGLEPRAAALAGQPASFDPLEATLQRAHALGLRVHAWVNVNLVASTGDLPSARTHVIYRHPEWLMVPRSIAREMAVLDPHTPLYLDKLVRATRSQLAEVEGLYLSPIPAGAADYTVAVIADLVARYPVDGIHLDYVRYPTADFDYSREAIVLFDRSVHSQAGSVARRGDPLAQVESLAAEWRDFRAERLTALVNRLQAAIRQRRPAVLVSAAVVPDAADAVASRFQDWRAWLSRNLIDVLCPMAYTSDSTLFTAQLAGARHAAADHPVWAGIGAYRLSSSQTIENIQIARRLGASGVVLFSYDSVTSLPRGGMYLSQVGRGAFGAQ